MWLQNTNKPINYTWNMPYLFFSRYSLFNLFICWYQHAYEFRLTECKPASKLNVIHIHTASRTHTHTQSTYTRTNWYALNFDVPLIWKYIYCIDTNKRPCWATWPRYKRCNRPTNFNRNNFCQFSPNRFLLGFLATFKQISHYISDMCMLVICVCLPNLFHSLVFFPSICFVWH